MENTICLEDRSVLSKEEIDSVFGKYTENFKNFFLGEKIPDENNTSKTEEQ